MRKAKPAKVKKPPLSPEMQSISRVRGMASWIRRTNGKPADYPKIGSMTGREIFDARQFAVGGYPWPARWTLRTVEAARNG